MSTEQKWMGKIRSSADNYQEDFVAYAHVRAFKACPHGCDCIRSGVRRKVAVIGALEEIQVNLDLG